VITVAGTSLAAAVPTTAITVNVGPTAKLVVTSAPPTSVPADTPFMLAVTATDIAGNPTSSFTGPVTLSLGNNAGGSTLAPITVNAVGGVATFSGILLNKAGSGYTLRLSSGTLTVALAGPIDVTPGAPTQLVVTTQPPGTVAAGTAFATAIAVEDANGNVVPSFTGNVTITRGNAVGGASATLGGTLSEPVQNGVASFTDLNLNKAANGYQLEAFSGSSLTPATTGAINIIPAPATTLVVTAQPTPNPVKAGSAFSLTVSAEDNDGNVDPNFHGTVSLSLVNNPGGATPGGTVTATPVNGVATFTAVTLDKATPSGAVGYSLAASSGALKAGTTNAVIVSPGSATKLIVSAEPPGTNTIGNSFAVTVSAVDNLGNVDPTFSGTVNLALQANPSGATLGGTTSATASGGVALFPTVTLSKIGSGETLQATTQGLTSATTTAINVQGAPATKLVATTVPAATIQAGTPFDVVVKAEDGFGDVDSSYSGSVTLTVLSGPGGTPVNLTQTVTPSGGVATFSGLTLTSAASGLTIQVSSGSLTPVTTAAFSILGGSATKLVVKTQPPSATSAGSPFGFVVQAVDGFGNVDANFNGAVTVGLGTTPAGTALSGTTTLSAFQGVATFFGLSLNRASSGDTLSVSATGLTGTSTGAIAVAPATAAQIVLTAAPPSSITAGSPFGLDVAIQDADGNLVTNYSGEVSVSLVSNPGGAGAGVAGTLTVPVSGGTATFSGLSLNRAASGYMLQVSSGSLVPAPAGTISVTPAAPAQLIVTAPPPSAVNAGAGFNLSVTAEDTFGNVVSSFASPVTLSILSSPGGGSLGGTRTVQPQNGVATFTGVNLNAAANGAVLEATSSGVSAGVTGKITVIAPPATVQSVAVVTQHVTKFKKAKVIAIQFGSAVDPTAAGSVSNYNLTVAANGKKVGLGRPVYNPATHQVTLKTVKPLVLTKPLHLAINVTGQTFLATLTKGGTSVSAAVSLQAAAATVEPVASVHTLDALLGHGFRPRFRHLSQ
jgi:hypothetical protein